MGESGKVILQVSIVFFFGRCRKFFFGQRWLNPPRKKLARTPMAAPIFLVLMWRHVVTLNINWCTRCTCIVGNSAFIWHCVVCGRRCRLVLLHGRYVRHLRVGSWASHDTKRRHGRRSIELGQVETTQAASRPHTDSESARDSGVHGTARQYGATPNYWITRRAYIIVTCVYVRTVRELWPIVIADRSLDGLCMNVQADLIVIDVWRYTHELKSSLFGEKAGWG